MFKRSNSSYNCNDVAIEDIANSKKSPLGQISLLIPDGAKVLDIGAGNGILASVLKQKHPDLIVDGIEPNPYAAKLAKKNYRRFYIGYSQDFSKEISRGKYDFIVLADVIEHMPDPLEFLTSLVSIISPKTKIIISTPNIAFGAIRLSLLNGQFNYTDSGILERTHLRFFTLKTLEDLISHSGLNIQKMIHLQRNFLQSETRIEGFKIRPLLFRELKKDQLSFTYQFLMILSKEPCPTERMFIGDIDRFLFLRYMIMRHADLPAVTLIKNAYNTLFKREG